ncbi:MAG: hypothetical protein ACXWP4_22795, partial [Polyangiales bacterium]
MKRALALVMLVSCATEKPPAAPKEPEKPAALAPIAVQRAFHVDDGFGFVKPDSSFAVVLTRAVEPVPDALVLLDQAGEPVKGTTTWLDRQLVVFYPEQKLPLGADLHLRIAVPLHASDGAVLSPREVDHAAMPPMKLLQANVVGGDLRPMSAIQLVFEREVPAADVGAHGVLTVDGESIDFIASDEGHRVLLRAAHGFPPGHEARFAWKEGPVVLTSAGRVSLEPVIK